MILLTWKHDCTVGVRAMDDQHGILMDAMNELRLAVMRGAGREQLCELLDRLIEFTRMHFSSEEQLMAQSGFPGLEQHRTAHRTLMAQVLRQAHRLQYGERPDLSLLMSFLRESFLDHIEGADRAYGPWLNEHGIR